MLHRSRGALCLFLVLVAAIFAPVLANGADFELIPSISQELDYNDNVFLTSSGQTRDFVSHTLGGLQLIDKTELLDLNATVQGAQSFYEKNTDLDSTDLLTNGTARYTLTPELALSGRANYTRDSQPDRELQTTGLVLTGVRREHYTFGAGSDYQLTEKTLVSLNYDHESDHYGRSLSTTISNLSSDAASLAFQHDLTRVFPSTTGLLNFGYTGYSLTGVDVKNYESTTGFKYVVHEKWSVQVVGGLRRTESSFDTFVPTPVTIFDPFFLPIFFQGTTFTPEKTSSSGWGGVGQASVDFKGEVTNFDFTASRDIAPASGQQGTVERTSFIFSGSRQISYEFQSIFSASYFTNTSSGGQFSVTPLNFVTFNVSPGIRYEFNKDMFLEGSYTFTRYEDRQADTTANRNLFQVRFFLQHTVLE